MSRVAVVGAGAVGATTAHDLAAAGVDVTLFEREPIDWDGTATPSRTPADAASARAAGVVYDAYAEDIDAALGARSLERFRAFDDTRGFRFHDCPYAICVREGDTERVEATRRAAERMRSHGRPVETVAPDTFGDWFPTLVGSVPRAGADDRCRYRQAERRRVGANGRRHDRTDSPRRE